ncbi:hypothetical protein FHX83_004470 [Clostridium beijerinckii]|nr:hypothetical protein [Clostridium beijerinckii]
MDGKSVIKWHKDINGKRVVDALIKMILMRYIWQLKMR